MRKAFIFALALLAQPVLADRLLVVSSGGGMWGMDNNVNIGFESLGANLVEEALKHKYSKVYKVLTAQESDYESAIKSTVRQIVAESKPGEKLDVFSMQHGPSGNPFDGADVNSSDVPVGFIRNVYSTGCNEFGDAIIRSNSDIEIQHREKAFSNQMEALGVKNYLYHVNMNGTGGFSLALLLKEFAKTDDWATAGEKAFNDFDIEMAKLIPGIQSLRNNQTVAKVLPGFKYMTEGWEDIVTSRLVVGSNQFSSKSTSLDLGIKSSNNYEQRLIPFAPELEKVVSEYCEDGFYDGANCSKVVPKMKLSESLKIFMDRFANLFSEYDPTSGSCLPGAVVNGLIRGVGYDLTFKEICLRKKSENNYKLVWKLEKDHLLNLRKKVDVPLDEVRSVSIATRGEISVVFRKDKTKIRLRGVKLLINGVDGEGKLKGITKFRPNGINIFEDGKMEARIKFIGIPLTGGVEGKSVEEIDMIDFFKLFGFRIRI